MQAIATEGTTRPDRTGRRRAIVIMAAAAGLGALGLARGLSAAPKGAPAPLRWRGAALGARASMTLVHPDPGEARRLIALALSEVRRLERVFSLYRGDSALVALNRDGRLDHPPFELLELLQRARLWSEWSGGAFDVTVQPLWRLHAEHFAAPGADPRGPDRRSIARIRRLVDFQAVELASRRIRPARPGMAITLNGIAQGYITDRVSDLLHEEGIGDLLVDLGEIRARGTAPHGRPWRVGLDSGAPRPRSSPVLEFTDRAVATSTVGGTVFDAKGRFHHLFDPATSRPSRGLAAAHVVARRATDADAAAILAAGAVTPRIETLKDRGIGKLLVVTADGQTRDVI